MAVQSGMELPTPILSFFAHLLSKDSTGVCLPGNEVISLLALSCGSVEEGARVAQALCCSGVLRTLGDGRNHADPDGAFDTSAVYDVVMPSSSEVVQHVAPPPLPLVAMQSTSTVKDRSPALGRNSLSLSMTRSASRDTEGATTSAGAVRLLLSSSAAGGLRGTGGGCHGALSGDGNEVIPASAGLVAALAQVSLCGDAFFGVLVNSHSTCPTACRAGLTLGECFGAFCG